MHFDVLKTFFSPHIYEQCYFQCPMLSDQKCFQTPEDNRRRVK